MSAAAIKTDKAIEDCEPMKQQRKWGHRAGVDVIRAARPKPTALDRVAEFMHADHLLTRKAAEAKVMERYPEFADAFPKRG
jgi:hypothetical protein